MKGFIFHFENIESKETTIVVLELKEEKLKTEIEKEKMIEVKMKLKLKTNENAHLFFNPINKAIKKFVSKWMNPNIIKEIKMKCERTENKKNENNSTLSPLLLPLSSTTSSSPSLSTFPSSSSSVNISNEIINLKSLKKTSTKNLLSPSLLNQPNVKKYQFF